MPVCELCGKEGPLFRAAVEGSELNVCRGCGRFGKILQRARPVAAKPMSQPQKELIEVVVDDYAKRIREAREKARLTQKDFAKALNERESIIKKLESGGFMPPLSLARKLEKTLKIVLVEVQEETTSAAGKGKHDGPLTIGDIAKLNL